MKRIQKVLLCACVFKIFIYLRDNAEYLPLGDRKIFHLNHENFSVGKNIYINK